MPSVPNRLITWNYRVPSLVFHCRTRFTLGKSLKRVLIALVSALAVAGGMGLLWFRLVQRNIAANMSPPRLEYRPEPPSDFPYRTLDGKQRHLTSTKGLVVFLDLWGTWCVQCVAEMPTVQRLYDHYRNDPDVEFLIVSRLDSPAAVRSYARRNHLNLPFYITNDDDVPSSMQLNQYPATFIYAPDGRLVAKHVGAADWSDSSVISFLDQVKSGHIVARK